MSYSGPIRVLIVEHNTILLEGISVLLASHPEFETVGTAAAAEAGFALYRRTRPDITLIDLDLPETTALQTIRHIRALDALAKVIGMAVYELDNVGLAALQAGAAAILAKDQVSATLVDLILSTFHS